MHPEKSFTACSAMRNVALRKATEVALATTLDELYCQAREGGRHAQAMLKGAARRIGPATREGERAG